MPKFLLFIGLATLLYISEVSAQSNLPEVYQIKTDTSLLQSLSWPYAQLLEDASGTLTIDDVSSMVVSEKFNRNNTDRTGLNKNIRAYWQRFYLKNLMDRSVRIILPAGNGRTDFYMQSLRGKWERQTSGRGVPYDQRDGLKQALYVYYELLPGQKAVFYQRTSVDFRFFAPKSIGVSIGFYDPFVKANYIGTGEHFFGAVKYAFLFGFMLLAAIINVIFFIQVKDKLYLYFAIVVLVLGLLWFLPEVNDVLFGKLPFLAYTHLLLFGLFTFFLWHLINAFFKFSQYFPRFSRVMNWLAVVATLATISNFFDKMKYLTGGIFIIYHLLLAVVVAICLLNAKIASRKKTIVVLPLVLLVVILIVTLLLNISFGIVFRGQERLFILSMCCTVSAFLWILLDRLMTTIKQSEEQRIKLVEEQNLELEAKVEERTTELRESLESLKTTQRQLIQAEKMASLGELTAGIAHEIQNPLNFINNFSEVTTELVAEMNDELKTGNIQEGILIASDIETNMKKISSHGKRADAIVKGMLQHSRTNSGTKELTDINTLTDEYLRLTYHGLLAKDKTFNADMITHFDPALPKINVVQQDMGRVMLNLFNNAFYAVNQKQKTTDANYKPEVIVTTSTENGLIIIKVRDNGIGIPETIKEKIMQPFFTTKPSGEGTGLGLSLTYDTVVKGHGGTIHIDTKEGEYSEFTIRLPLNGA